MYPVLIDLGRFKLHSYGLMMFLAFAVGIFIAYRRARKFGIAENVILDFSTAIIVSGILGGRILYIFTHLDEFRGRWLDTINPVQSDGTIGIAGLVLLGGVVLATVTVVFMAWLKNVNILQLMDVLAIPLALGIGIGRVGCYLNGCCFGLPTELPWGVVFPETCIAGSVMGHQHIHPTQLYAVIYSVVLFVGLSYLEKKKYHFKGFTISTFFIGYGIFRFINETLRYYEDGMKLVQWSDGVFTVSQFVSVSLVAVGVILFIFSRKKYPLS